MPLPERIVQPVSLGGHPLDVSEAEEGTAHLTVASNSLIGALLQLASLVRHADDLFCDISDECQKVFDRSERISKKLSNIEVAVSKLDAKDVPIQIGLSACAVGDLSQFSQTGEYHVTKHGFDSDLFTKETRSQCIRDQYAQTEVSPSHILRGADIYRKDGLCSSRLFRLWPVLLREPKVKTPDLNLPRKTPSVFTFEKRYKKLQQRPKTIHVTDEQYFTKEEMAREAEAMSESLSQSTSASLISIDTSGQGFERMESLRGSQRSIASKDREAKRKKRRRTVSGVSDHIMREIEAFERKKKNGYREQPRDYSFDDIDMDGNTIQRDEEMVKYLDEIDAKMEERKEIEHAFRKPKILRLLPCRRSRSLPRCLKLHSMKALTYDRQSLGTEHSSRYEGDSISLASAGSGSSRLSRSTKRSSIISNKIKSLVNGSNIGNKLRPRPKSLDLDAIDFDDETMTSSLAKNKMPSMPDGILSEASRDSSKVGPGSYYNFESESNTLPRRQPKRVEREFTWNAMPKDWTTSVKLREISKRRSKEDRQSSSGNWSGSSSNRHSLDSDVKIESMPSTSQCSLGQDSGRDSPTLEERSRCDTDTTGGYAGDGASTVSDKSSMKDQKGDTDKWLQNLAKRAACREDASSSSAETLNSLTRLTKQNIMALDLMMSPSKRKPAAFFLDDDESVYSVDQEGFYTSFHNDSGLRRSCGTLVDEDMSSPTRDTQSVTSFESVINTSDTDKYAGLKRGASQGGNKVLSKVNPPAPPPRTSSCPRLSPRAQDDENPQPSPDMVSRQDSSSMSESDQESIYMRLKSKTQISSNGIPSICPMSSDEEGAFRRQSGGSVENEDKSNLIAGQEQTLDMNQNLSKVTELTSDSSIFSVSSFDASSKFDSTFNYTDDTLLGTNKSESEFECQTLPRTHHSDKEVTPSFDYTKSWPRSHKKSDNSQTPVSGILKSTDRSLSGPKPNKSLNFSPVINMFNPGTPQAVQMPLPCSPASSEEGNRRMNKQNSINSPDSAYKLAVPITQEKSDNKAGLPMKYQPVIVVKPGQRPGQTSEKKGAYVKLNQASEPSGSHISPYAASSVSKQTSGPYSGTSRSDNLYAVSPVKSPGQRMENAADSGYLEMNGNSSIHSMESQIKNSLGVHHGSVLSLESEDSFNFTGSYVSMASPCSSPNLSNLDVPMVTTPTGSMDSLLMEQPSKGFISIDESNLSSTMETVAISTNSFSSFGGSDNDRSFSTFSGPPPKPSMSSTPQTTSQFHPPRHNRSVPHQQQSQRNNRSTPSPQPALPARVPLEPHNRTGAQRQPNYRPQTSSTPQHQRPQKPHYQNNVMKRPENYHPLAQKSTSKSYSSSHLQKSAMQSSRSFPSDMTKYAGTDTSSTESISTRPGRPRANASVRRASAGTPSYNVPPSGSDSDSSSNANGRNDSYRVAMVNPSRNSSYRVAMKESKSCPSLQNSQKVRPSPVLSQSSNTNGPKYGPKNASPVLTQSVYNKGTPSPLPAEYFLPQADPEDFNRTDSYRFAVRNTHGVVSEDNTGRNSSYRVAVKEMDSMIPDNHMSGVHSVPAGGRDMRRMGITDVDQVKGVAGATKSLRPSESTSSVKLRRPAKTSDVDPISVLSSMNSGSSHKTNKNRHSTSSTYIRFDPIFEDKEDITGSMDSLRDSMGSLKMADSSGEMSFYGGDSFYGSGKPKVNALSNGRLPSSSANEKSSSSLFSNVKNFVRQKSSSKNSSAAVIEDDCRFTMV